VKTVNLQCGNFKPFSSGGLTLQSMLLQ